MTEAFAGIVLAFDTATAQLALACGRIPDSREPLEMLASSDEPAYRRANSVLLDRSTELLASLGLAPADVACVVCGRGPGSFTGVRIGVATAKGVACGLRVPLFGVSTLDAVAWNLWEKGVRGLVGVVGDAMRGEVYPVRYRIAATGPQRIDADEVSKPTEVAAHWDMGLDESPLLCGDALGKHRDALVGGFAKLGIHATVADEPLWLPTGRGLLLAFEARRRAGLLGVGAPGSLLPVYTRLSDAEEHERERLGLDASGTLPTNGVADSRALEGVLLRPLSVNDIPDLLELEGRSADEVSTSERLTAEHLEAALGSKGHTWWVARLQGVLVGYAGLAVTHGTAQLTRVVTDPDHRDLGIAERLFSRVVHDALDLGATSVSAVTLGKDCGVDAFLGKMGMDRSSDTAEGSRLWGGALPLERMASTSEGAMVATPVVAGMGLGNHLLPDAGSAVRRPLILAIESSCDETAAAVIDGSDTLYADIIASQVDFHARFGGVVPEIASRKHTEAIVGVVEEAFARAGEELARVEGAGLAPSSGRVPGDPRPLAWSDLDAIAVTVGPGLVGALVVGLAFAKGASWATGLPLIAVNHLEGHLYANRLIDPDIKPPLVALLVSGGNTMLVHVRDWGDYRILGETLDDAVGEAFDKVSKALGLGYPGGPILSRLAKEGDSTAIDFPRAMLHSHDLRFSLSGLKTAVITYIHAENAEGRAIDLPNLAASFQQAVIDVLVAKATDAVRQTGVREFCMGGGVSANPELRHEIALAMRRRGVRVTLPLASSCTDNAGMIGAVARERFGAGRFEALTIEALPGMDIEEPY